MKAKYKYQQSTMFIAHRIKETVGSYYGWSFGTCLKEAHQAIKGKPSTNTWVQKLMVKAKEIHRINAGYAIAKGMDDMYYWKECYSKAWRLLSKNWEFRQFDDNPNIAKAVKARLKSQERVDVYYIRKYVKQSIFRRK